MRLGSKILFHLAISLAIAIPISIGFAVPGALAAEFLIHDEKSQPESLTVTPRGDIIIGSGSSPYIYMIKKGAAEVTTFIDVSAEGPGNFFWGQLVDAQSGTLWTCQLTRPPGVTPAVRRSSLRGFDLATGKEKVRWELPGDNFACNDFSIGPDRALYSTDTFTGKIYRLAAGAKTGELFMDSPLLLGANGIAFLDGVLYVDNQTFNKLYRVPIDASGKPGAPVDIWMDAPIRNPDGMRASNGKLLLAASVSGEVVSLTIKGDTAHVTVLKDSLNSPTAVEVSGDTLWFTERRIGKVWSIPLPK
jgi:hypothetical protein